MYKKEGQVLPYIHLKVCEAFERMVEHYTGSYLSRACYVRKSNDYALCSNYETVLDILSEVAYGK